MAFFVYIHFFNMFLFHTTSEDPTTNTDRTLSAVAFMIKPVIIFFAAGHPARICPAWLYGIDWCTITR
jgi:hypothetical protein